jgi:ATP-dependent RNA helicase DeaD
MSILSPGEQRKIKMLEKQIRKTITRDMVPDGKEVFKKRLSNYLQTIADYEPENFPIEQFEAAIEENLGHLTKEELLKRFIAKEFSRVHEEYKNAPNLNTIAGGSVKGQRTKGVRKGNRLSRFSINLGDKNNMRPDLLINIINRHTPEYKIRIGKIEIQNKHTVFEAFPVNRALDS